MSKSDILRGGTVAVQSFAATLGEVIIPSAPRRRAHQEAALARQKVLDQAREEVISAAHTEGFGAGQKAGYQAGFDQAYAEASNTQAEMIRAFAAELQQVHDNLEESIDEWFAGSEQELEALSIQIAEKLIDAQLELDRSFVIETTKATLQQLSESNRARIRVNPFDSVILNNAREELLTATANLRGVEIVCDSTIVCGCVVETERGAIDATVETRLKLLEGGMEGAA